MRELRLGARAADAIAGRLRGVAADLDAAALRDGSWFARLTRAHLAAHAQRVDAGRWDRRHPGVPIEERARREVDQAARRAAGAGALAALVASGGELATLATEGLAGVVGVPAALLSIVLEAIYQALMQVNLVLDLGVIYGDPFGADDAGEIAALFALALASEAPAATARAPGMAARLAGLDDGAHAAAVGRALLQRSFARNAVPVLGVAISARRGRAGTATLGAAARRHLRLRRALRAPLAQLRPSRDPALLVEGTWLVATAGGQGDERGLLSAAAVLRGLTPEQRHGVLGAAGAPGTEWLERLGGVAPGLRPALLELLYLVAATGGRAAPAEDRLLRRVGEALGQEIDLTRVERLRRHLASGEDPAAR